MLSTISLFLVSCAGSATRTPEEQDAPIEPEIHELVGRWESPHEFRVGGFRPLYQLHFYDTFEFNEDGSGRWGSHSSYPFGLNHYGSMSWSATGSKVTVSYTINMISGRRTMRYEIVGSSLFLTYTFRGNREASAWELVRTD